MDFSANAVQALTIGGNAGDDVIKGTRLADTFNEYGKRVAADICKHVLADSVCTPELLDISLHAVGRYPRDSDVISLYFTTLIMPAMALIDPNICSLYL